MDPAARFLVLSRLSSQREFTPEDYDLLSALDEAPPPAALAGKSEREAKDLEDALMDSRIASLRTMRMPDVARAEARRRAKVAAEEAAAAAAGGSGGVIELLEESAEGPAVGPVGGGGVVYLDGSEGSDGGGEGVVVVGGSVKKARPAAAAAAPVATTRSSQPTQVSTATAAQTATATTATQKGRQELPGGGEEDDAVLLVEEDERGADAAGAPAAPRNEDCSICLEDMPVSSIVKVLPCLHRFHSSCIDTWLRVSKLKCPVCKLCTHADF
jgi:hypothetical protein